MCMNVYLHCHLCYLTWFKQSTTLKLTRSMMVKTRWSLKTKLSIETSSLMNPLMAFVIISNRLSFFFGSSSISFTVSFRSGVKWDMLLQILSNFDITIACINENSSKLGQRYNSKCHIGNFVHSRRGRKNTMMQYECDKILYQQLVIRKYVILHFTQFDNNKFNYFL